MILGGAGGVGGVSGDLSASGDQLSSLSGGLRPPEPPNPPRILVLGVGNLLLGDEGVGVHALRRLETLGWPAGVSLLDGGTGGFHLLSCFDECDALVLVDATLDDRSPGTVRVFEARRRADFPRSLSAHDIGLRDLFDAAALLDSSARIFLVTVSVAELQPMQIELSAPVAAALPDVESAVAALVERLLQGGLDEGWLPL